MKIFLDKTACITGAASGIGQALSIALAQQGCHLCIADIDPQGLTHTANLCQQAALAHNNRIHIHQAGLDVSQREAVYTWANTCVQQQHQVHLVINNAGMAYACPIEHMEHSHFEHIMNVNFWGIVHGTQAFLPHLKATGDGHIVNMSSLFGLFSQPTQAAYNASKFAVRGFTESLRQELDLMNCGVSASCVHPGGVQTAIVKNSMVSPHIETLTGSPSTQGFEKRLVTCAHKAAHLILKGVQANKRRILIGPDAWVMDALVRLLPQAHQRMVVNHIQRSRGPDA